MPPGRVRLDRGLSKIGIASRAEARRLVSEGRVSVNGRVISDPAYLLVPERADIRIDNTRARRLTWRTLAFNKPRGVITTRKDPAGRRTVFDLIGDAAAGLVAVGRLDLASSGLLLLTSDTQLANRLTDPANGILRKYVVTVRGMFDLPSAEQMIGGSDDLHAVNVRILEASRRESHLEVQLDEGKNREIRRLCARLGYEVTRLLRVSFGPIELGRLQPGEWRELTRGEFAGLDAHRAFDRD